MFCILKFVKYRLSTIKSHTIANHIETPTNAKNINLKIGNIFLVTKLNTYLINSNTFFVTNGNIFKKLAVRL